MPPTVVRWVREQAWFLLVLAVMAAAFGYLLLTTGHWRRSTALMGASMLLAAVLRATLPEKRLGLLRVRGRWRDTVVYGLLGALMIAMDLRLQR